MMDITKIELEKIKFVAMQYISDEFANEFAISPQVEVTNGLSWMLEKTVIRIRQDIFGRQLDKVEIRYPSDWWQAFKQRWFPEWLLKRYPVIEEIKIVDILALYPDINLPGHRGIINVWEHTDWTHYTDEDEA
jgi:hypothetical protein